MERGKKSDKEDRHLGVGSSITRRDFLNSVFVGSGAGLLAAAAPGGWIPSCKRGQKSPDKDPWSGYGDVGAYARSPGNPREMVEIAHRIRDGDFGERLRQAENLGESYDLVVVGGGMAGLSAAHTFVRERGKSGRCLILDNHPVFGGESKRNEFVVEGTRVIGPQGANDFGIPEPGSGTVGDRLFDELSIPRSFRYQAWENHEETLRFGLDHFGPMWWSDHRVDVAHRVRPNAGGSRERWVRNPWEVGLEKLGGSSRKRKDLRRWREGDVNNAPPPEDQTVDEWLDTLTYKELLRDHYGLGKSVIEYADPILAGAMGLGADAISAYGATTVGMPVEGRGGDGKTTFPSFPGGNATFTRYFVKDMIPDAIEGTHSLDDVITGSVSFESLDRSGQPVRIRLGSTAVNVEHDGSPGGADRVRVTYFKDGELFRVNAKGVVMATGSWVNEYILPELPASHRQAYQQFHHSPFLVANVALTNWRFIHKLGATACRWYDGFGFFCNIRRSMVTESYQPPLDPDDPVVLTLYVPLYFPGEPAPAQGIRGRKELLSTPFADYERSIRRQLVRLFGDTGFDPGRDIAGIVLNRWGHAYVNPQPGFYFGKDGAPAPKDVIQEPFGRISIGHSELEGHQNWVGAVRQGERAAKQVLETL